MTLHVDLFVNIAIWVNIECNVGIVSACIPAMRPLFNMPFFANARSLIRGSTLNPLGKGSSRTLHASKKTPTSIKINGEAGEMSTKRSAYGHIRRGEKNPSWYTTAVGGNDIQHKDGILEDDRIPLGRIAVRYEIELSDEKPV